MLNVTMHWYGFQTLTMRLSFSSGESSTYAPSSSPSARAALRAPRRPAPASQNAAISRLRAALVDDARLFPFFFGRIFDVAEHEHEGLRFAGASATSSEWDAIGDQPLRDRVLRFALDDGVGLVQPVVQAEERLAVGVEARELRVHVIERVVVAPLAVFGLVIERAADDLDFAGAQVALEVRHVVVGVPQAEFDVTRRACSRRGSLAEIGERDLVNLRGVARAARRTRARRASPSRSPVILV